MTYLILDGLRDALTDKIMEATVGTFANWLVNIVNDVVTAFTDDFAPSLNNFFTYFGYADASNLPSNWSGYQMNQNMTIVDFFAVFAAIGYALALIILILSLFQLAYNPMDSKDSISSIFIRFFVSILFVTFSKDITDLFFNATLTIWDNIINRGMALGSGNADDLLMGLAGIIGKFIVDCVLTGGTLLIGTVIVGVICTLIIMKEFLSYMTEIVERYFVACVLYMVFPAVAGTYVSKQTSVLGAYIKMLVSQLILLLMNLFFIRLLAMMIVSMFLTGDWQRGVSGAIYATIIIVGFLRVAQKIDSYMRSLGLNPAITGGGLVDSILQGATNMMHMGMMAAGAYGKIGSAYDTSIDKAMTKAASNGDIGGYLSAAEKKKDGPKMDTDPLGTAGDFSKRGNASPDTSLNGFFQYRNFRDALFGGGNAASNTFNAASSKTKNDKATEQFGEGLKDMLGGEFSMDSVHANGDGTFTISGRDADGNSQKFDINHNNLPGQFNSFTDADGNRWNVAPSGRMTGSVASREIPQGMYSGDSGLTRWSSKTGISTGQLAAQTGLKASDIKGIQQKANGVNLMDKNGNTIGFVGADKDGNILGASANGLNAQSLSNEFSTKNSGLRAAMSDKLNPDLQWSVTDMSGKPMHQGDPNGPTYKQGTFKVSDGTNSVYMSGIGDVSDLRKGSIAADNGNPSSGAFKFSDKAEAFTQKNSGTNGAAPGGNPDPNNNDNPFGPNEPGPTPESGPASKPEDNPESIPTPEPDSMSEPGTIPEQENGSVPGSISEPDDEAVPFGPEDESSSVTNTTPDGSTENMDGRSFRADESVDSSSPYDEGITFNNKDIEDSDMSDVDMGVDDVYVDHNDSSGSAGITSGNDSVSNGSIGSIDSKVDTAASASETDSAANDTSASDLNNLNNATDRGPYGHQESSMDVSENEGNVGTTSVNDSLGSESSAADTAASEPGTDSATDRGPYGHQEGTTYASESEGSVDTTSVNGSLGSASTAAVDTAASASGADSVTNETTAGGLDNPDSATDRGPYGHQEGTTYASESEGSVDTTSVNDSLGSTSTAAVDTVASESGIDSVTSGTTAGGLDNPDSAADRGSYGHRESSTYASESEGSVDTTSVNGSLGSASSTVDTVASESGTDSVTSGTTAGGLDNPDSAADRGSYGHQEGSMSESGNAGNVGTTDGNGSASNAYIGSTNSASFDTSAGMSGSGATVNVTQNTGSTDRGPYGHQETTVNVLSSSGSGMTSRENIRTTTTESSGTATGTTYTAQVERQAASAGNGSVPFRSAPSYKAETATGKASGKSSETEESANKKNGSGVFGNNVSSSGSAEAGKKRPRRRKHNRAFKHSKEE